jgi:hypothetical protein
MDASPESLYDKNLNTMDEEELKALRHFLFEERIALINERRAQEEFYEKFMEERLSFREEMKQLNSKVLSERKRLKDEQAFFDKKLAILQNGFASLEMDRKAFQREKDTYEKKYQSLKNEISGDTIVSSGLFSGVSSYLALRKRYKELIRIFHPDNLDGDNNMALLIKEEYEKLREKF